MMNSVVVLVLVCAASSTVFCCEPCSCRVDDSIQKVFCHNVGLTFVPGRDMLPDYIQVLDIDTATIPTIKENQFVAFKKLQTISITLSKVSKVERHAFRDMTHVTIISLAQNLITELPAGLFLDTPGLVDLYLFNNNLKVLTKNLFSKLNNLKLIHLSSNQIVSIVPNCFENVPRLEKLYLYDNKLTTLNINFIDNWSSFNRLWLYQNPWHCDESLCGVMAAVVNRGLWRGGYDIKPACATPQSLQWKEWPELEEHALLQQCTPLGNITHQHVTAFRSGCEPCSCRVDDSIQKVFCHNVGLSSVPGRDMLPDYIQVLDIDTATIPTIKENQFVAFKKLQTISITLSKVSKVERHAFRDMTHVTIISLAQNLITELPAGLFLDTPGLVDLYLFNNNLKVLTKNLFSKLNNLKLIHLSSNQIVSIVPNCFENVPRLEKLYLYDNKLTTLNINFIDNWSSFNRLWLYQNPWHCDESLCGVMAAVVNRGLWRGGYDIKPACATPQSLQWKEWPELEEHALLQQCTPLGNITHQHVTDQQFTTLSNTAFNSHALLQELHLERNQIRNIKPNTFLNLNFLSVLNLSYNKLQDLPKNIFSSLVNLEKILLNYNSLTRLNKFQFTNMLKLKEVDLSFNNISFIEEGSFMNVSSLRTINLSNNQLQTLQLNVMDFALGLERLHLEGNPWHCNEALCEVLDAVVGRALWGPGGVVPTCTALPTLAGKSWLELPQHFHPDMVILDSNMNWTRAGRATSVLAAHYVMIHCKYCFVSRVTWTLNCVRLPLSYQQTSHEALISSVTLEIVHKLDESAYVCQVSQCPECDTAWIQLIVNMYIPDTRGLQPECGKLISEGVPNVVNSTSVRKGEFPWHIGLYRQMENKHVYLCGGSLINPLIILTAAHCLTDSRALRYPDAEFYIGAGKYYRDYNSLEDTFAQRRQVKKYYIPVEYRGVQTNYAADLAVVVVNRAFRMTHVVQPVCMDWAATIGIEHLLHNQTGSIVGWGYVDPNNSQKNNELKRLDPPIIGKSQCLEEVPENFLRWVTGDKFCAGFRTGASLCNGDSGGGLVLRWNNTQRYVIRGLTSVGPTRKGVCDDTHYAAFTNIAKFNAFLQNIVNANPVIH